MSEKSPGDVRRGKAIRIAIADDHAVLAQSLAALLNTQPDFQVVGTATSGSAAVELVKLHHPNILVLDLFMPDGNGFDVLRRLHIAGETVASVVLTGSDSQLDYVHVVKLGARGLVLKGEDPGNLFAAIRLVAEGELAFSNEISKTVLDAMASESRRQASSLDRLSERERQIAVRVARGLKNRDIAGQLSISENTVKRHLQSIFRKAGVRDRLELAVLAVRETAHVA